MADLTRRERILLRGVAALTLLAAAWVVLPRVRRRIFPKIAVRVIPRAAGESDVLPRRAHPKPVSGSLRVTRESLVASGEARRWVLVSPAAPEPGRAYPVVLVLHGDGGGADSFHAGFPFEQASGVAALLAYPEGRASGWDLETTRDNVDVRFMELLVDALATRFTVDRTRVFAAGYSRGGFFANVLACQRAGFLRALSSSAGGAPYGQASTFMNGFTKCPGQEPTAAIALHGTADMGVGIDSGRFSAEYWAYVNGCKADEMEPTDYPECTAYRGCPKGKQVAWCEISGLGHWVWDRAAEASWTFFQGQARDAETPAASP